MFDQALLPLCTAFGRNGTRDMGIRHRVFGWFTSEVMVVYCMYCDILDAFMGWSRCLFGIGGGGGIGNDRGRKCGG